MAKQIDGSRIVGTIGNITYYKVGDEYYAKQKSTLSGKRVKKDQRFANTRRAMAEFGAAAKAGQLLRRCFNDLANLTDNRFSSRLTGYLMRVIKSDTDSEFGSRRIMNGQPDLLKGLEFNDDCQFANHFTAPYTTHLDQQTGNCRLTVPAFKIRDCIKAPKRATHFRISVATAAIDFDANKGDSAIDDSEHRSLRSTTPLAIDFETRLELHTGRIMILAAALEFFQIVGGKMNRIGNGGAAILDVKY